MKRFFIIILAMFAILPMFADDTKLRIAVFDPTSNNTSIDEGTRIAVREMVSSTIVNTGYYDIVERSLLEKVMQEQQFSNSGVVDDKDATEIGKLAGASKIILSVVTLTGGRNMISLKMIDVKTASVERQQVKIVSSKDLLDVIEPLTLALINQKSNSINNETVINTPSVSKIPNINKPIPGPNEVVFWLPEGFQPKKEKHKDLPLMVKFDKENIGSGTIGAGFLIRLPNPGSGVHKLQIGAMTIKVDLDKYNFFELQVYRWTYLGTAMYGVSVKEQKMIK